MAKYALFEGRHQLPENEGAICQSFDFVSKSVVKTELWDKAIDDKECMLLVTGLTPALTQFISEYKSRNTYAIIGRSPEYPDGLTDCPVITLLHFDSATNTYWQQDV